MESQRSCWRGDSGDSRSTSWRSSSPSKIPQKSTTKILLHDPLHQPDPSNPSHEENQSWKQRAEASRRLSVEVGLTTREPNALARIGAWDAQSEVKLLQLKKRPATPASPARHQLRTSAHGDLPQGTVPRSYADVVKTPYFPSIQPQAGAVCPKPSWPMTAGRRRRCRISFGDAVEVAVFNSGDPPATFLGRPTKHLGLSPHCSKSSGLEAQNKFSREKKGLADTITASEETLPINQRCLGSNEHVTQDGSCQQPWQQVRERYWWRKLKKKDIQCLQPIDRPGLQFFKKKTKGRCYNCLAKDHRKSACRDPPKCWTCWRAGHISSWCPRKATATRNSSLYTTTGPKHHHSHSASSCFTSSRPAATRKPPISTTAMDRRLSIGSASAGSRHRPGRAARGRLLETRDEPRRRVADYPGNPRSRPRVAEKMVWATNEMMDRREMLMQHALVITEEGSLGVASREEVTDLILHHLGLRRYEVQVYRSYPEPFIAIFSEQNARDRAYIRGRLREGPIELHFHAWDIDRFGERLNIPYHVKLCIEGLPQHAWFPEVAEKVLSDQCVIHHVDGPSRRREDQRVYVCWAFCLNPSAIPQLVYVTLTDKINDPRRDAQIHFSRPRNMKNGNVFRVLIHLDSVEDLMFYHYPPAELEADGKVQLREFNWEYGRPDGDLDEDFQQQPPPFCRVEPRYHPRDEDEDDRERGRPRNRDIFTRVSRWIGNRSGSKGREMERERRSGWYRGESSRGRQLDARSMSPPPSRFNEPPEDRRALKQLWKAKPEMHQNLTPSPVLVDMGIQWGAKSNDIPETVSNAILIEPTTDFDVNHIQLQKVNDAVHHKNNPSMSDAIDLTPLMGIDCCMMFQSTAQMELPRETETTVNNDAQDCPTQQNTTQLPVIEGTEINNISNSDSVTVIPPAKEASAAAVTDPPLNLADGATNTLVQESDGNFPPPGSEQVSCEQMKQAVSAPLKEAVLPMPKAKKTLASSSMQTSTSTRSSPRLKNNLKKQKPIIKMAQEVLAKKWGVLDQYKDLEEVTLQQYLDFYKKPLDDSAMEAIKKLTAISELKRKKKKKIAKPASGHKKMKKLRKAAAPAAMEAEA